MFLFSQQKFPTKTQRDEKPKNALWLFYSISTEAGFLD